MLYSIDTKSNASSTIIDLINIYCKYSKSQVKSFKSLKIAANLYTFS